MLNCSDCNKTFASLKGLQSHRTQVHDPNKPRKDHRGENNPMFGKKGSNQWAKLDWSSVPWELISYKQKRIILIEEAGHACTQCGFDKKRDDGGEVLEIDHINGDHEDNVRSNLRVLCPNCHALTPNFRNWGNKGNPKRSSRLRRGNKGF